MSTATLNYAVWTGAVGFVLEYLKRKGTRWETLFMKGGEKALVGLISSYIQMQGVPFLGTGLDANYIYNGILGAAVTEIHGRDRSKLQGAEEQILCALLGHRLAANWGTAFDTVTSNFGWINNMFAGSSGYQGATVDNQGTPTPSMNSGNPTM
jgi:hypothetical protein